MTIACFPREAQYRLALLIADARAVPTPPKDVIAVVVMRKLSGPTWKTPLEDAQPANAAQADNVASDIRIGGTP